MRTYKNVIRIIAFVLIAAAFMVPYSGDVAASPSPSGVTPPILPSGSGMDRDENLLINGSFEEGHPGFQENPHEVYNEFFPGTDILFWAPPSSGSHVPAGMVPLATHPSLSKTPTGWTGRGGNNNYAQWGGGYFGGEFNLPGFGEITLPSTGIGFSTAPTHGKYALTFGNYYMSSISAMPVEITKDGEWIFEDSQGNAVDPTIIPGQPILTTVPPVMPSGFQPPVTLNQRVKIACPGETYKLSFTVAGEYTHPYFVSMFNHAKVADGVFGLKISGYDMMYLNVPGGHGFDALGNPSPFGKTDRHRYTIEIDPSSPTIDLTFYNWGQMNIHTMGWQHPLVLTGGELPMDLTQAAQLPPDNHFFGQTTSLILDDVILNGPSECPEEEEDTPTTAKVVPATGFAKGVVTNLPQQPAEIVYQPTNLQLQIPAINKEMAIIGVPRTGDGWDVSWLGNNAGYLAGSAFPTWTGNTVLTAHVWDADNDPGPFADLKSLKYGDLVKIQAFGSTYTYEVRDNQLVTPRNTRAVFQHEEIDWVTLVTCEYYNPLTQDYFFRRMVRAVLISVE